MKALRVILFVLLFGVAASESVAVSVADHGSPMLAQASKTKKNTPAKKGASASKTTPKAPPKKSSAATSAKKTTSKPPVKKSGSGGTAKKNTKKAAAPRTSSDVKKEQQATTRDIKQTAGKLDENRRNTAKQLGHLSDLRARIEEQTKVIESNKSDVAAIETRISLMTDTIDSISAHVQALRNAYAEILRKSQGRERMVDMLTFVFASESFEQAVARIRYMRYIGEWRRKKSAELTAASQQLRAKQADMQALLTQKNVHINNLNRAKSVIEADSKETSKIVAQLEKEGASLQAHLEQQQKRLTALDKELDRLIAAEQERARREEERRRREAQRRAEEQAKREQAARNNAKSAESKSGQKSPTPKSPAPNPQGPEGEGGPITANASASAFASMKGRLPFPVEGRYRIVSTFGRHAHPEIPSVQVDNSGIDIEMTGSSARARVICDGVVSAVFNQPGYNNIVMIRHGEYLTVYAGLENIAVKTGESVAAGQTVGQVQKDPDNDNRRRLHFEVRHEREKLNPLSWVR